jgi:hypothetical protein
LLAGFDLSQTKNRSWMHSLAFAAVISGAIYVTLDYEYPRFGVIRLHSADHFLTDLRKSMN